MIRTVTPVDAEWIHEYITTPLEEGLRRLNLVLAERTIYSVKRTSLSLKDRAIALITGLALVAFPINTMIWIAWQTFGHPTRLYRDRYSPEVEIPARASTHPVPQPASAAAEPQPEPSAAAESQPEQPAAAGQAAAAAAAPEEEERRVETFSFKETGSRGVIQTNWKVTRSPSQILVHQCCDEYSSTSVYGPEWALQKFNKTYNKTQLDILVCGSNMVTAHIVANGVKTEREFKLQPNIPLVQQTAVGLRKFISDTKKSEFPFCTIIPENRSWMPSLSSPPHLMNMIAKKVGQEKVADVMCCKVELISEWKWPFNPGKGELWFDKDGVLRKFVNDPLENSTGDYLPSGL